MKKTFIVIGPIKNHYSGQSIVTNDVVSTIENYFPSNKIHTINTDFFSLFGRVFGNTFILLKLPLLILNPKHWHGTFIYFTPSRNLMSSLKDFWVLLLSSVLSPINSKAKIVAHLHGSDLHDFLEKNGLYGRLLRKLYFYFLDEMIILSKSHKKYALGEDFARYTIIANPVSEEIISESRRTDSVQGRSVSRKPDQGLRFITVSAPIKDKGVDRALDFIEYLNDSGISAYLDIVGWTERDIKAEYGETVSLRDLNRSVQLHGSRNKKEIARLLEKNSFFIFLSNYSCEAQPLSVLESAAFGLVPIVTDFKFMSDFSTSLHAITVPFPLKEGWKEELSKELTLEKWNDGSIGLKNRSIIIRDFSIDRFKRDIQNVFAR